MSTIYAKDPNNYKNVKNAKRLLLKALNLNHDVDKTIEICIYQNLTAVCNQQERFFESLKISTKAFRILSQIFLFF